MKHAIIHSQICIACLVFALCLSSCNVPTHKTENGMEANKKKLTYSIRLEQLLSQRNFHRALLLLDTLNSAYPQEATYYFARGWVYDMQNKKQQSRQSFTRARELFDSLATQKHDLGHRLNHAYITQVLYGRTAYLQELAEIKQSLHNAQEIQTIQQYESITYEKEKMFTGTITITSSPY